MMDVIIKLQFLSALILFQDLNLHNGATSAAEITHCDAGTYLNQDLDSSFCVECPDGTFMPWKNHTAHECFECTKIEDSSVEILISKCDRFRDADIQCVDGYYRRLARNPLDKPSCLKCTPTCHYLYFEVHPCANFSDIGCCPGENYDYYIENGIHMCRERPWMCRQGQYLDSRLNDCKPCPENTFMSEDYHSHTNCWNCTYNSEAHLPLHTVITKPCSSTQPPRYSCKDGFYRNDTLGLHYKYKDFTGCSPCQACEEGMYEVRPCNTSHNTLCCGKPSMIEVDGRCADVDAKDFEQNCKNGTYNPPACDQTCSQHCRVSERSDQSPCDHNNGTCLFGCLEGYTGSTCETLQGQSTADVSGGTVAAAFVIPVLILIVILIFFLYRRGYRVTKKGPVLKQDVRVSSEETQSMLSQEDEVRTEFQEERQTQEVRYRKKAIKNKMENQRKENVCDDEKDRKKQMPMEDQSQSEPKNLKAQSCQLSEDILGIGNIQDEKLSKDQGKEFIEKEVTVFQDIKVLPSKDGINCLALIKQTFWDYPSYRQEFGDFLAELGFANRCMYILKGNVTKENVDDDKIWPVIENIYIICWNYSCQSPKFAKELADCGAVRLMTTVLKDKKYLDNLHELKESWLVKVSIGILLNIAAHGGNIPDFVKSETSKALMSLTESKSESIKVHALYTLACIAEEKEKDILTDDYDIIEIMVQWIHKALSNEKEEKERKYEGFTPAGLTADLAKLAVNSGNRRKIVDAGALDVFQVMLQHTEPKEQRWTAECIKTLALDGNIRQDIKSCPYLISALENLKDSVHADVRYHVGRAIEVIKSQERNVDPHGNSAVAGPKPGCERRRVGQGKMLEISDIK